MNRFELVVGLSLATCAASVLPSAEPALAAPPAEKKGDLDLEALEQDIDSGDPARMMAALETVKKSKDPAGAPIVLAVLTRGATTDLLILAFEAAGKIKAEATSGAMAPYVRHRSAPVRQSAVKALLKTGGKDAVQALTGALRSRDAVVRGMAATGLGNLGAEDSLDDLFKAFDRGVAEAAASIGLLCKPQQCERFAELSGKKPFDVMVSGYDQVLFRPPKEMPDDQKIRLIGRLRELGTVEAAKYLADVAGRWPKDWSPKVKAAIDAAARASGGAR